MDEDHAALTGRADGLPTCDVHGHQPALFRVLEGKVAGDLAAHFAGSGISVRAIRYAEMAFDTAEDPHDGETYLTHDLRITGEASLSNGATLRISGWVTIYGRTVADEVLVNGSLVNGRCVTEVWRDTHTIKVSNAATAVVLREIRIDELIVYTLP